MNHLKTLVLLLFTGTLFYGCDPCGNLDCIVSDYNGMIRIVKASDGTDLVFGAGSMYNKNEIRFFSVSGPDTTFLLTEPIAYSGNGYDSILHVDFSPPADPSFMRLNSS